MTEPTVLETLRGIQFLRDLSDELIDQLAGVAQVVEVPAGTVIFRQGEAASTLHLIVQGNVSLEICAPGVGCKRILTVGEGEFLIVPRGEEHCPRAEQEVHVLLFEPVETVNTGTAAGERTVSELERI